MTTSAIIFMIISMLLIWGGLLAAILHLRKHPDIPMSQIPDDQIY
ncbi:methionine/alanine import family NSS transporter small subunit [Psychrobacter sp. AH5]